MFDIKNNAWKLLLLPGLNLVHEDRSSLVFSNKRLPGIVIAAIGVAFYALTHDRSASIWQGKPLIIAICGLFVLLGLISALTRLSLKIDLVGKSYRLTKGFAFIAPVTRKGLLTDIEGVALTLHYSSTGNTKSKTYSPAWHVELHIKNEPPICIGVWRSEVEGYASMEHYAKILNVNAIDRTGGERIIPPDELDLHLTDSPANGLTAGLSPAPGGLPSAPDNWKGVHITRERGGIRLLLPPAGLLGMQLLPIFIGAAFISFPLLFMYGLAMGKAQIQGSEYTLKSVLYIFLTAGLFLFGFGVSMSVVRREIRKDGDELSTSLLLFGRRFARKSLKISQIEAVDIKAQLNRPRAEISGFSIPIGIEHELFIRSDDKILRIGTGLKKERLEWLRNTVLVMIKS